MLSPLIKLATGLMLLPEVSAKKVATPVSQVEVGAYPSMVTFASALPVLPPGCEDFRLRSGDISQASIFLMAESHYICDEARQKCTKGLLNSRMPGGIDPDRSTLLFENFSASETFPCSEMSSATAELSSDCRGWNLPASEREHEWLDMKGKVLKQIAAHLEREFPALAAYPLITQKEMALNYVQQWIDQISKAITNYETQLHDLSEKYKTDYPLSQGRKITADVVRAKFGEQRLRQIHRQIMQGEPLNSFVPVLNADAADYFARQTAFMHDPERSLRKSNQAMLNSIRAVSKKKFTVVYAGRAHVDPMPIHHVETRKETAKRQKIIAELYGELAHTNPYAVLSCTIGV